MSLKPVKGYDGGRYPKAGQRLVQGLFVAAAMTATSLGGCGPGMDSRTLDETLDQGDLDGTVDCSEGGAECEGSEPAAEE